MCQELLDILDDGVRAAKAVLEHMLVMGADAGAIPVRHHDDELGRELSYMVCVMPRDKYDEHEEALTWYRAHKKAQPSDGEG